MQLRFFGNCAFEWITSSGCKVFIDPFQNSSWSAWFKVKMPHLYPDVVLVTHPHFDHNAVGALLGKPQVITRPGHYRGPDVDIYGIAGRHSRPKQHSWWYRQLMGYRNTIFVVETEGLRFCHWGDNNSRISQRVIDALGQIDVLMLPMDGGEHLLSWPEIEKITGILNPKILIPMHYRMPGLTTESCPLKTIDDWLALQPRVRHVPVEGVTLGRRDLDGLPREVWVFKPLLHVE